MRSNSKFIDIIIVACIYFAALVGFNERLNSYALYVFIPISFILTVIKNGIETTRSMKQLIILYIWIALTCLVAAFPDLASRQMRQILGCVLLCYIMAQNSKNSSLVPWLYGVYVVLFLATLYYGMSNIVGLQYDIATDRMDDENLNANTLAYFLLYSTVSVFILAEVVNKVSLTIIFRLLFWLMFPIAFWVAIYTASRQTIITAMPLLLALVYVRYIRGTNRSHSILILTIVALAILAFLPRIESIYEGSYLKQRTELDLQEDSRTKLLIDATQVGLEHPLTGVGPGNYVMYSYNKHFSHCTYTELLANCGIPGLVLYLILVSSFISVQIKRYKQKHDIMFLTFILYGLIYIVDNFFYVFYPSLWLISFFILVYSHSDSYYSNKYIKAQYAY